MEDETFYAGSKDTWTSENIKNMRNAVANYVMSREYLAELKIDSSQTVRSLLRFHEWFDHCEESTKYSPRDMDGKYAKDILYMFL